MAARRTTAGLTSEDLAKLAGQLADGGRPRVQLSGPQFPAETAGTVVGIGSPDTDGADFIRVRMKVNGVTDELAFSPAELTIRRAGQAPESPAPPAPPGPVKRTRTAKKPAGPSAEPAPTAEAPPRVAPKPSGAPAIAVSSPPPAVKRSAAAGPTVRRGKPPVLPKVSVTLTSAGAAWSVTATRGAKTVAKNVPVPPGTVTAIAELLGQDALVEAVAEINETALNQARDRAEALRAELADLEAVLATHRAPS